MFNEIFFCISAYNGCFDITKYSKNHIIFLKEGANVRNAPTDLVKIPNYGYNIYAYLLFIIENYSNLPEFILFTKNNVYPRHISEEIFVSLLSRKARYIFDPHSCEYKKPFAFIDIDGKFCELNNSWYLQRNKCKFFGSLNSFLNHFFDLIDNPQYVRFPPGGNILVRKNDVLCRPIEFYEKLVSCIDYTENAPESFFLERSIDMIFNPDVSISKNFENPFPNSFGFSSQRVKNILQHITLPLIT